MTCLDHDRLHALLDGALAPDEARAAERHIAECSACQAARESVARLRDSATAILSLGRVTPRRMPPFAVLAARAAAAESASGAVSVGVDADAPAAVAHATSPGTTAWRRVAPIAAAACVGLVVVYAARAGDRTPLASTQAADTVRAAAAAAEAVMAVATPRVSSESVSDPRESTSPVSESLFMPVRVSFGGSRPSPMESNRAGALERSTTSAPQSAAGVAEGAAAAPEPGVAVPARQPSEPAVAIAPLEAGASARTVATDDNWAARPADELDDEGLPASATTRFAAIAPNPTAAPERAVDGAPRAASAVAAPMAATAGASSVSRTVRTVAGAPSSVPSPAAGDSIRARIRRSLQRPLTVRSASLP